MTVKNGKLCKRKYNSNTAPSFRNKIYQSAQPDYVMTQKTRLLASLRSRWGRTLQFVQRLGPTGPLLFFALAMLLIYFVSRFTLNLLYLDRLKQEPKFLLMYPIGMRIDAIVICYALFLPTVFFLLLPQRINRFLSFFWTLYFTIITAIAFFLEMSTFAFVREYDLRPDSVFVRYLKHYKEVGGTVWKANKADLIVTVILLVFVCWFAWRSFRSVTAGYRPWRWTKRLLVLPVAGALLFLGARSSLAPRPANISTAYWSEQNKLVNEFTLNSTYSVLMAVMRLSDEKDPSAVYGSMSEAEIFRRVRSRLTIPDSAFVPSEIPFLHRQESVARPPRPLNVVIVLEESLGAEYVGFLGGLPLTPNFDRLSKEGLSFTDLYSTGTRTVRGIEATVTGFLPTPGNSVVNLGLSRNGFFTAGELFRKAGYSTHFVYGGESNFDEMRSFFLGNGFEHIHDLPTFRNPVFKGVWGVSDEDLMVKADEVFRAQGDKPFFSVVLSTSNHSPFEFPDGRIDLYEQPKTSVHNAMKYADYAIGKLFALAKKSGYYKNTLFLVVADHNTRVFGDEFVPVHKFHIPGVLIGPNVPVQAFGKVASQVDLLPTILHFAGLDTEHPMIGRDLMAVSGADPGRCFMQYGNNFGYMVGDTVTILKPYLPAQGFLYDKKTFRLSPLTTVEAERARDALAFSLLPWKLYETKRYHLR
jgi:phosphoglycerol transferase MdoB-like AlkP superfamily enzyme